MRIHEDERTIQMLNMGDGQGAYRYNVHGPHTTGWDLKCDKIVPYQEDGEMAPVTWFEIHRDGQIVRRVNGKYVVEVVYEESETICL